MKDELEIKVNAKIEVADETAIVCRNLLNMYCKNRRGDFDPGYYGCSGCVFLNDKYCEYKQLPVCSGKEMPINDD